MRTAFLTIRDRLDRMGVLLSGLCVVHCVIGLVIVSLFGLGGGALLAPVIHEAGLIMAIVIGFVSLGFGVVRHGRPGPLIIGACGIALMAAAIAVGHGLSEALLTIAGVALVATAHIRNLHKAY
ncbi:MAG: MerC domain-containing protein [Novosphingobium sp.]|nr:MerC domain-containing protein [Novosphingobium sp.]